MANNTTTTNNKKHDFGKKNSEQGKQTCELPTFKTAEKKAIELIESEMYGLEDSDFWILKNNTKSGGLAYSNLIISHNGCLKINDKLPPEKQFKSEYLGEIEPSPFGGGFIMKYDDGVLREYGEVSSTNCKNPYPVAMLLKRVMDRVILKKSGIAYAGIYSEVESDEFKATIDDEPTVQINEETGEVVEKKSTSAKTPKTSKATVPAQNQGTKKYPEKLVTVPQINLIKSLYTDEAIAKMLKSEKLAYCDGKLESLHMSDASNMIEFANKKKDTQEATTNPTA